MIGVYAFDLVCPLLGPVKARIRQRVGPDAEILFDRPGHTDELLVGYLACGRGIHGARRAIRLSDGMAASEDTSEISAMLTIALDIAAEEITNELLDKERA